MDDDAYATPSPRFLFGANPIIQIIAKTSLNNKRRVSRSPDQTGTGPVGGDRRIRPSLTGD